MTYSHQTYTFNQVLTAAQMNQGETNIRDHVHGRSGVAKTGISFEREAKTAGFSPAAADIGKMFAVTSGTFSVTPVAAGTLGAGGAFNVHNVGTGIVTIDPDGSETIEGQATASLPPGGAANIYSDGSNLNMSNYEGMVPLVHQAISADATIDFNDIFTTRFNAYRFIGSRIIPATDNTFIQARVGISGTPKSGAADYDYAGTGFAASGVEINFNSTGSTLIRLVGNQQGSSTAEFLFFDLLVFDPANASVPTYFSFQSRFKNPSGNVCYNAGAATYFGTIEAVTDLQFFFSSGNLASGSIQAFGLAHP